MKITITIEFEKLHRHLDIQIDNEQIIYDTLSVLKEQMHLDTLTKEDLASVKDRGSKRHINTDKNYEQAKIYSGAYLIV
jgi:hypothetical protein